MENKQVFLGVLFVLAWAGYALGETCLYESYCNYGCCDGYCCEDDDVDLSGGVWAGIIIGSIFALCLKICCWIAICRYYRRRPVTIVQMAPAPSSTTVVSTSVGMPSTNPYHAGYNQQPMSPQPQVSQQPAMPAQPPSYSKAPEGPPPAYA